MTKKKLHVFGTILLLVIGTHVLAQKQDFSFTDKTVQEILEELDKSNKFPPFAYSTNDLRGTTKVNLHLKNATIWQLLDTLIKLQPITYKVKHEHIYISHREEEYKGEVAVVERPPLIIEGRVTDENSNPIAGANIFTSVMIDSVLAVTNIDGRFRFKTRKPISQLKISHVSYETASISIAKDSLNVVLKPSPVEEVECNVNNVSYVRTTGTGNVTKLTGINLGQQPLKNLAQTLNGRVAGLFIKSTSGAYGTFEKMQIRSNMWLGMINGVSTVSQNGPLIILDHTPLPHLILNQIGYIGGNPNTAGMEASGLSSLRAINVDDIESVDILKDGDATAIYGSKGANGVIIVTTKKAKNNEPYVSFNMNAGIANSSLRLKLLNTSQYLTARRAAFKNDNLAITNDNAPDLTLYDTGRNVDYKDYFLGNNAFITRGNVAISEAGEKMGYRLSMGLYREGTIMPGKLVGKNFYDQDIDFTGNMYGKSKDGKLSINVNGIYFKGKTSSTTQDVGQAVKLAPNTPDLLDSTGSLVWNAGIINPLSYVQYDYMANIVNVLSQANASYTVDTNFSIKSNVGLNILNVNEQATEPIKAQNPAIVSSGTAEFASTFVENGQFELFGVYKTKGRPISMENTAGFTIMKQKVIKDKITATGIPSDYLLLNQQAAELLEGINSTNRYGYIGFWGNSKLVRNERYILNLTLRYDGSSRFGANKRYGLFGGIGAGWVFTKDTAMLRLPEIITFGKLKASYGTTGNDEIGDYSHNGSWVRNNGQRPYGGISSPSPTMHTNEDFSWGVCRKFEIGTELTFKNLINFTASYYYNVYTNQLIKERLPNYTGFGSIIKNNPVKSICKGFEFYVQKKMGDNKNFNWECAMSATFPRTKLAYFPAFETSNYSSILSVGSSINTQKGFVFLGVNPSTGVYEFLDINQDNKYTTDDYRIAGSLEPRFYGGFNNTFTYKSFVLDFLWEYAVQKGINQLLDYSPVKFNENGYSNIPVQLLQHWQKPGDVAPYQVYSANPNSTPLAKLNLLRSSNAQLINANYLRLKNISLFYTPKVRKITSKHMATTSLYVAAENCILITKYIGADPGSQRAGGIPILKRFSIGFKLNIN